MAAAAPVLVPADLADVLPEEPTLLEILTAQIVNGKISVAEARDIVRRRENYKNAAGVLPDAIRTVQDLDKAEAEMIFRARRENDQCVRAAARSIGMRTTTLYRKLRKMRYEL